MRLRIIRRSDEVGGRIVVCAEHHAALDGSSWAPGFQGDPFNEWQRDGPERFGDDLQTGGRGEVIRALVDREPASAAAVGVDEVGGGEPGSGNRIEQAAVNQLPGDDGLVAVGFREGVGVLVCEGKLVAAQTLEFPEVIVAGIGAGEGEAGGGLDGQVELGGELEVNELAIAEIPEKEVEFAKGGPGLGLDLKVSGEKFETWRGFEQDGKGVLVEMAEFLPEVQGACLRRNLEVMMRKAGRFRKGADEERSLHEALKEGLRRRVHGGVERPRRQA